MSLPYSNRCNMFPHRPPTCIKLLLMEFRPYNSSLVFLRLSMAWAGKKLNLIFFFINSMSGPQLIRFNYPFPSSPDHTYAWVHLIAIWVLKKSKWMIRTTPNHFFFFFQGFVTKWGSIVQSQYLLSPNKLIPTPSHSSACAHGGALNELENGLYTTSNVVDPGMPMSI